MSLELRTGSSVAPRHLRRARAAAIREINARIRNGATTVVVKQIDDAGGVMRLEVTSDVGERAEVEVRK